MTPAERLEQQLQEKLGNKFDVRVERGAILGGEFDPDDFWTVRVRARVQFAQVVSDALLHQAPLDTMANVVAEDVRHGFRKELETLDLPLIGEVRIPQSLWFTIKMELLRLHPHADQLLEGVKS